MKVSYNWLQNYFEEKLPNPEKLSEGIIFHSFEVEETIKVGDDIVFDIKVLPDRAHDCLSHWGIAKEISAIFNLKLSSPNGFFQEFLRSNLKGAQGSTFELKPTNLKIEIQDEKCLRYMGRVVRNIKIGESPAWLKEKLEAIGQKSINNVVDMANFVMFDLGQPIHAFDLDKLNSAKIIVRSGNVGEKLTTLDKKDIELDESVLVIADEKDPLAIAGIKGGTKAEVDDTTKNIVIEVANFNPVSTRKTAKKIGILTDAVKRYENEISPELCKKVMNDITDMIINIAGGEVEDIVDVYNKKPEKKNISVSVEYINKHLGSNFTKEEIENVWKKLNFEYAEQNGVFDVKVPILRLDITGSHDLLEEVIRILGYDRLEEKLPEVKCERKTNELFTKILYTRNKLLSEGYSEVMTYAFRNKGEVEVLASASDKKFVRSNLTDGLRESFKLNQLNMPVLELKEVKVFEIGTIFKKNREEMRVAFNEGKEIKEISLDDFCKDMGDVEKTFIEMISLVPSLSDQAKFKMWSLFPFITRDVAVWVKSEEEKEKLKELFIENGTELLIKEPYLFDSFTNPKDGRISYAFRLIFQSYERTLTDDEVNEIMAKIGHKIRENSSWEIR
ncbi:phenylalanine--tRNA ligase subunit beta [Patescibacteria group bacterium]|nr:phenylalanine--tRNA ligase subunit beta [Patescibacteria group bacterium]MBU1728091.1 phenylalanine--tRNA ligase subunit beta [Patescibacteria group bacterium]